MTALREAAQQALEALQEYQSKGAPFLACDGAVDALRAALAQQEEPTGKDSLQVESVVAENATTQQQIEQTPPSDYRRGYWAGFAIGKREGRIEAEDELAQQAEPVEPVAKMTAHRAVYFMERFKREEKMLGPNEQAALDFVISMLEAALAEPEPAPTVEFDHGIGADRFKVARGAYWWHILIGDSPIKRGKFHTKAGAEEMVVLLLREFRNGAFVQHNTAPPQQAEPMALDWLHKWANQDDGEPETQWHEGYEAARRVVQIHLTAPPQRKPLTQEEIDRICASLGFAAISPAEIVRAVERAHGIGEAK